MRLRLFPNAGLYAAPVRLLPAGWLHREQLSGGGEGGSWHADTLELKYCTLASRFTTLHLCRYSTKPAPKGSGGGRGRGGVKILHEPSLMDPHLKIFRAGGIVINTA